MPSAATHSLSKYIIVKVWHSVPALLVVGVVEFGALSLALEQRQLVDANCSTVSLARTNSGVLHTYVPSAAGFSIICANLSL
jgi:hypothetical protein